MLIRNPSRADNGRSWRPGCVRSAGNYIIFYLPLDDGIEVVRILSGYLDITPEDME
jgi:toxin ParE1/3/4